MLLCKLRFYPCVRTEQAALPLSALKRLWLQLARATFSFAGLVFFFHFSWSMYRDHITLLSCGTPYHYIRAIGDLSQVSLERKIQ